MSSEDINPKETGKQNYAFSRWEEPEETTNNQKRPGESDNPNRRPSMDTTSQPIYCVPGQPLLKADDEHLPGEGVYLRQGYFLAAVAGLVSTEETNDGKTKISVLLPKSRRPRLPALSDVVTGKVTHVGPMGVKVTIHCVEDVVLRSTFKGIIRKEDIRQIEKGTVEPYKCFRVGDIVLARVVGVGEHHSYLLSTAEDELGVAVAYSFYNKSTPMVPVSWTQMRCPKTYVKEYRKVAKILFD